MKLKKTLSFWDVFSIALGQVIGSGIMVLIGIGIEFTAYAVPFAFVLSATLSLIKQMPVVFMGSAMPATGGLYVYCKRVLGDKIGFFFLALLLITHILIALFALGFANYVAALIPALEENIKFVALGILVVFYFVNLVGIRQAAALQKVMIVFLLVGLSTLIFFGIFEVDYSNFTSKEKLFPSGWYGFALACVVMSFATGGAYYVSELGGEMKNPHRDLPRAIVFSTLIAACFFALVSIVAVGILPIEQTAGKTLSEVARTILPAPVYGAFIVGAGLFALATSINSTFSWATKSVLIACEDGWLPKGIAVVNKRFNTPHILLTILLVIGAAPILVDWDLTYIIMLGSGLVFIYDIFPLIAAFLLSKRLPKVFAAAKLKMSEKTLKVFSVIGILILAGQGALAFSDIDLKGWILIIVYIVFVIGYIQFRSKSRLNGHQS
ncbi:MAG: amino acid permease [Kordiimonadaceae bacterium]|jgi:APA family basic amino acid/polyamine antiporter|nr:amino acid permease [Kordiimonadaceae bacterium]MBT7544727.1 amino acid permease [Kordiimonadaceae bacterium]MDB4219515.1 APC family permease [Emcibacteraceae bacterium]MDC0111255.1 APC family permease [Emcibacteraceae bacterium]MDC1428878.1 APC family permease [Emcibacteraceae bacterium]|tara:strand:- start:2174 stop:3487 length:1314 start_codon:yes stop_codon:yes gene_type:complete